MSSCLIKRLTQNGLQAVDYSAASLADAVQYEPDDGVYTVANTFNTTQTLMLDAHLDRLEDSARRANISLKLDRSQLKNALRTMILESGFGDVRFRVTVPKVAPDEMILSIEPFTPLSTEFINKGVRCITAPNSARHNAAAKTTDWMHNRRALTDAMPEGIYDTILLDASGNMMEGLGANFYAIVDGVLYTAGEGVLFGISQRIVFAIAPSIIAVEKSSVNIVDIPNLNEAFITSSSRGIVPVIEIDGLAIGNGAPGEKTKALINAYNAWVNTHLQDL